MPPGDAGSGGYFGMVAQEANRRFHDVFQGIQVPVIAATWQENKSILSVHVGANAGRSKAKAEILTALAAVRVSRVRLYFHTGRDLTAPRSLERLIAQFGTGDVVYDPTESISRAKALVAASRKVRESLTEAIAGIFFAPRTRTLFVSLAGKRFADAGS